MPTTESKADGIAPLRSDRNFPALLERRRLQIGGGYGYGGSLARRGGSGDPPPAEAGGAAWWTAAEGGGGGEVGEEKGSEMGRRESSCDL
ncbi:hypothetical protein GUJ93_ZPchr0006g42904 [Zizania palustris]|uniref:Uncharacterized protein n=1 Tax=Zizania palustris TaxID=103762 RepID=A0A8J5VL08_ZIZPA|nr:hypothetical protein GUJ93_ZPchr0006g42904 [Zizania palustris]